MLQFFEEMIEKLFMLQGLSVRKNIYFFSSYLKRNLNIFISKHGELVKYLQPLDSCLKFKPVNKTLRRT